MTDVISNAINKGIIIIIIVFIVLVLLVAFFLNSSRVPGEVVIITDKTGYALGETLIMNINNNLAENICFSPCSLGLLEKKNAQWETYLYEECKKADECLEIIEPRQVRAFEFDISMIEFGLHRIVMPACINCRPGDDFREDQIFYSNEFTIK